MATRKPKNDDVLEELYPSQFQIEEFMEEWSPQASIVEIYQMMKDGSRPHQERVGIEILKEDLYGYLRQNFGAGKFHLQFKDSNRRIVKGLTVDVAAGRTSMVPLPIPATGGNGDYLKELVIALIASMKPTPLPPPPDIGAMLAGIGAIMTAVKPATTTDPAAMLTAMAATFQQLKPAEDNVEKALKVISLAKDIGGNGEPREENFYTLLKDVGKTVVEKLAPSGNGQQRPAIPPGAVPVVAQIPTIVETQPVPIRVEESPDVIMEKWLRAELAFLKQKATAGKDPEAWADYLLDNDEEPGCHAVLNAVERGATMEHLLQFDPQIGENPALRDWFVKFYAELHSELFPDVDTPGPGGDAADAGGNAKPSPPGQPKS
jgi:hypothetical protein